MKWVIGTLGLAAVLGLTSCRQESRQSKSLDSNIVVSIGDTTVSREEFVQELRRRFPGVNAGEITPGQKQSVLEALIRNESIYAQAKKAGFDRTPDMQAAIRNLLIAKYKQANFTPQEDGVSDQEIEAYYHAHPRRFATPVAARGAVIYVACPAAATPEKRNQARNRAEQIAHEARQAVDAAGFAKVVARHSDHQATRYRAGDTGWLSEDLPGPAPEARNALLSLENTADFAPLIETAHGFWIVKLNERREAGRQPLAEVKEMITYELSRQKAEQAEVEFFARMRQGIEVRVNHVLVDSITIPPEKLQPPKTPGGQTAKL